MLIYYVIKWLILNFNNLPNKVIFEWYPSCRFSLFHTVFPPISCLYHKVNVPLDYCGLTAVLFHGYIKHGYIQHGIACVIIHTPSMVNAKINGN